MAELDFQRIDLKLNQLWVDKEEHTTSHRVVQIMPTLREWLSPYCFRIGKIQPTNYQNRWDALQRKVGLFENWPHDGLRHSFGTWHFTKFQDLGKTSAQMGHNNPTITRKHYVVREDPSRADEYWNIIPTKTTDLFRNRRIEWMFSDEMQADAQVGGGQISAADGRHARRVRAKAGRGPGR